MVVEFTLQEMVGHVGGHEYTQICLKNERSRYRTFRLVCVSNRYAGEYIGVINFCAFGVRDSHSVS